MVQSTCKVCSDTFSAASKNKRYCSEQCKWAGRPRIPCVVCGKPTGYSLSDRSRVGSDPTCSSCRSSSHDYKGYKRGCRCEICRAANAEAAREYARKVKERDGKSPSQKARPAKNLSCDRCGKRILSKGGTAADGLTLCKQHRDEKTDRDRKKVTRRRRFEAKIAKAAAGTLSKRVWVQGACLVCSEQFISQGAASRYCSRDCRRVARSGSRWISFEDRRGIYDRDDWLCQICYEPVSSEYHMHDPWSPTLDHIIPRSAGGPDDPENLRLCHLWCNSVRGDLSHYTDEDLREAV